MRKWFGLVRLVLIGCLVGFGLAGCSNSGKETTVRIGFQVIPNTEAIARANGWHEATMKGAKVEWLDFESGRDVNNALASGSIDIGLIGSTLVATGLANHIEYKVIWLADVIGANEALAVKADRDIQSVADLVGKTVAVTFGSTTQYTLLGALKLHGVDPADVDIIDMRPPDMLAAWKRGDIDAGYVWHPTLQEMLDDGGRVLLDSGDLVADGIVTADTIVVREEFAKNHPELVRAYLRSQIRAVDYYRNQPDQAAADVAKLFEIKADDAKKMMEELIWLSGREQASPAYLGDGNAGDFARVLEDTAQFLYEQKLIPTVPESGVFRSAVDPSYLLEVLAESNGDS